jgi:very-short-patch-repair endonuclease
VIGTRQLAACGAHTTTIVRWRRQARLHHLFGAVYILGHDSVTVEGLLTAAVIHAGPDAALSHATAAWWWGLIPEPPRRIQVSTTSRPRSIPEVKVHHRRRLRPVHHKRIPVTPVGQTLVDYAATATDGQVRRALAEADYLGLLDLAAVRAATGRGRAGCARLRRALKRHEPRLARTRSRLERAFLELCESHGLPLPEVNARVGRMTVDALWPDQRLVVELDGHRGHRSPAQLDRDRRRELHCRTHGLRVNRYTEDQVQREPELVAADLRAALNA